MNSVDEPKLLALTAPRRFPDEITSVLLERIVAGHYPPGSKLPSTRELSDLFRVSPPIIREALSRLKYDGYVEPRQGSGVFVRASGSPSSLRLPEVSGPGLAQLADTYETRLHVEQSCAELAAARRNRQDLAKLRKEVDAMAKAVAERVDGTAADVRFHFAIAAATHNATLSKLVEFLHGSLAGSVQTARSNSDRTPGQPEVVQSEHEAIFRAIEQADPAAARAAVRRHLEGAAARLGLRIGPEAARPKAKPAIAKRPAL